MARRRPTYKQLPLPFNGFDLTERVRMVLPPGLRELAEAEKLDDEQVLVFRRRESEIARLEAAAKNQNKAVG